MAEFFEQPGAVPPEELQTIRASLLESPYVGQSPLAGSFDSSRGFALTFRKAALPRVYSRFPGLLPFLSRAISDAPLRRLLRWPWNLVPAWGRIHPPNAFYCNVLILEPGHGVGMHIDGTLREDSGNPSATPRLVSVLYVQKTSDATGGRLRIFRGAWPVGEIEPEPGKMVHFRGDLRHEVLPFQGGSGQRISLVCEQYAFRPHELARIPEFAIHSKNGFRAYLAERQHRKIQAQE